MARPTQNKGDATSAHNEVAKRLKRAVREWKDAAPAGARRRTDALAADTAGVDIRLLRRWMAGTRLPESWTVWVRLSDAFGVSVDWLLGVKGAAKKSADVRLTDELATCLADHAATSLQVPRIWVHPRDLLDETIAAQRERLEQYDRETGRWLDLFNEAGLSIDALDATPSSPEFFPMVKAWLMIYGAAIDARRAAYKSLTAVRPPMNAAEQRAATMVAAIRAIERAKRYAGRLGHAAPRRGTAAATAKGSQK